jgi:DNA-binding transcriptional LysR family regulator
MEIFYFVAYWKSFSRAAAELGVSKGYVSTQITNLERDLGVRLLQRSTRYLSLTEEGQLFFESCAKIVHEKQQSAFILKELQTTPSGHLKISASPSMCSSFLLDLLPEFQKHYPQISIELDSSSAVKNLLQHGIDLALRITHTPNENSIARILTSFKFVVCATPHYLKKQGTPKTIDDLLQHNCLIYSADPAKNRWPFEINQKMTSIAVQGNLVSSESLIVKNATLNHQGITRLPEYILKDEIIKKDLVVLFDHYTKIKMPIYAIYQSNITIPLKIKCFIDFLKKHI